MYHVYENLNYTWKIPHNEYNNELKQIFLQVTS